MRIICVFLAICFFSTDSYSQDAMNSEIKKTDLESKENEKNDETPLPPPPQEEAKKIVITGSYIRQAITQKAPTPLSTYDQSRMLETGSFTVADALQESAVFNNVDGGAFLSMHGQSSADNLVLLNGMRLPKTAGGTAVNIDFLPATAIEKVEVLKDGASALYGSEALAGVVNILTKKDYDGANFFARHTAPQEGIDQETTLGLTYGKTWGTNRFLGILQFKKDDPAYFGDTNYGTKDVKLAGSLYSNFGNLINGTTNHRDPDCPADRIDSRGSCRFDSRALTPIGSGEDRSYYTAYLGFGKDISKQFNFDIIGIYTRRDWTRTTRPIEMDFRNETSIGGSDFSVPDTIANSWGAVNASNGGASTFTGGSTLTYSALEELGQQISERQVDNYITQVRTYGEIAGWDWEASGAYGLTFFKDTMVQGNASKQGIYDLILASQFNPLKTAGSKDSLSAAALQTWFEHTSDTINSKALAAGPLFDLWNSPLSMAVGVEGQWQSFEFNNDPFSLAGIPLTGSATNQSGRREVYSTFVEFTHSPIRDLDIQLAGRFDEYSDVGSTVNPKLGISYHASEKVTFRSSYGTGFKAPDLLSVFQGQSTSIEDRIVDPVICAIDENDPNCSNTVTSVTTFGNKNLKPETAAHYNIGAIITPQKSLVFSTDFWVVDGEQGLSAVDPDLILRAQSLGVDLSSYGIVVTRDPSQGNIVTSISHPVRVNAGIFKIRGIDFGIQKQLQINPFKSGNINVRLTMEHSHVLSSGGTDFNFDPFTKQFDLNWKNFASVGFQKDKNFLKIIARTLAGGDKNTNQGSGIGKGSTYTFTEYDIHYERFFSQESSFSFGIKNMFDIKPLNDTAIPGAVFAATSQSNFLGRTFYAGYSYDF
jgi:iron complex outermembrane recepter protein